MIRIRYILLLMFGVLAMLPVLVFGFWSSGHLTRAEFDTVESRHLLVAENLGLTLDRYYRDLTVVFDTVGGSMLSGKVSISSLTLLSGMGFRDMCLIDRETGALAVHAMSALTRCTELLEPDRLAVLRDIARTDSTSVSPVMRAGEDNLIYLVRRAEHQLIVGSVRTGYFQQLTDLISFGENGHAAIVDAQGNILAHPNAGWAETRRDLSSLSIVQRMMKGESGVARFYSPMLDTDMVAGFISVPETGWGIMVPQPVSELYAQAAFGQRTALTVLGVSLLIAIVISVAISFRIANPLERLIAAVKDARQANKLSPVNVDSRLMVPDEVITLQESYNEMVATLNQSQSRIRRMAYSDTVTGLANREAFQQLVTQQIARLEERGLPGVMVLVDLDDFKSINDTLGHDWGDAALRGVAAHISEAVTRITGRMPHRRHPGDPETEAELLAPTVARVGGDEFTLFVPLLDADEDPAGIVKAIRASIAVPLVEIVDGVPPTDIRSGGSVGAALFPSHGNGYEPLIKFADIAMYHAKRSGKNRYCMFSPEIGDVTAAELRRDVARGLAAGEFVLHYQPKVSTHDDRVNSAEALVRWNHPERGFLMPGSFIPMIEEMDVMASLGEWALDEAARQAGEWEQQGIRLKVAVNIATAHFGSDGFVRRAGQIIADSPVDASRIQLEITEETMLGSLEGTKDIITALQDEGFEISLDDYGRGYSNLTRLANLTVNSVKIDGPLTRCLTTDQRTKVIVASTIDMAHGLGCLTVAEGVETLEQAQMLRSMGCDVLQGYYFARPMPAYDLARWMETRGRNEVHEAQQSLSLFVGNSASSAG